MSFLNKTNAKLQKRLEIAQGKIEDQNALIEYVAIMADVELPEEENNISEVKYEQES